MRRIDEVNNKKMKNIKQVIILDKKRLKFIFNNNQEVTLEARSEEYGCDEGIYFKKDNI